MQPELTEAVTSEGPACDDGGAGALGVSAAWGCRGNVNACGGVVVDRNAGLWWVCRVLAQGTSE